MKKAVRQRRKDARPQEIVAAALQAFSENGFAGTKIEDIAAIAGVAKGTVYLYYETKDALFEAVVRENISPLIGRLDAMTGDAPKSAAELLSAVINRIYVELIDHPARRVVMRILISEGHRFPHLTEFYHNEVMSRGKQVMRKILKHGIDAGEFRVTPALANPEVIIGPAIMAAVWKMTFDDVAPLNMKNFLKAHLDLVLNGLLKS